MIGATLFNTLVQQVSYAKNIEIFNISIRDIEKALAPKSTTNPAKKLPIKYLDFLDVFSQADSDILPPHRPYNHVKGRLEVNQLINNHYYLERKGMLSVNG